MASLSLQKAIGALVPLLLLICECECEPAKHPYSSRGSFSFAFCSDIPLVITAFLIWKFWKKTKYVRLADIPLLAALDEAEEDLNDEEPVSKGWIRLVSWIWD
jgi:amino acid permease